MFLFTASYVIRENKNREKIPKISNRENKNREIVQNFKNSKTREKFCDLHF